MAGVKKTNRTKSLGERIEAVLPGWDPVLQMAFAARGLEFDGITSLKEPLTQKERLYLAEKVAPYMHARLKALEVSGEVQGIVELNIGQPALGETAPSAALDDSAPGAPQIDSAPGAVDE